MERSGVWRGEVTRTAGGDVFVRVPRLRGAHEFGPVTVAQGVYRPGLDTQPAAPGPHVHVVVAPLAVGDKVIVAFLEGRENDVVVLDRL